jgi:hypothetical protein
VACILDAKAVPFAGEARALAQGVTAPAGGERGVIVSASLAALDGQIRRAAYSSSGASPG